MFTVLIKIVNAVRKAKLIQTLSIGFLTAGLLISAQTLFAGSEEVAHLTDVKGGLANDQFGESVSISGKCAIVGIPYDDYTSISTSGTPQPSIVDSGTVQIYCQRWGNDGDLWRSGLEFKAIPTTAEALFGSSVSISDNYAIVGAPKDSTTGAAYMFHGGVSSWGYTPNNFKITASDKAPYDFFGTSVAVSGNYAIIGSPADDDDGTYSGSAYIYKTTNSGSSWTEMDKLTAGSDGAANDRFGKSVAISGDIAVVGASDDKLYGLYEGSVYVFKRSTGSEDWIMQQKLTAGTYSHSEDYFGKSVSISGNYLIIGAPQNYKGDIQGSAYIFKTDDNGATWELKERLTDSIPGNKFGESVSISGDYAIVGAPWSINDGIMSGSGSAYIYVRDGESWTMLSNISPDYLQNIAGFGISVGISGHYAIIGAIYENTTVANTGSAHIYYVNRPPVAIAQSVSVDDNSAVRIDLTGSDDDGDNLTFEIVDNPNPGEVVLSIAGDCYYFYPKKRGEGTDSFTFRAYDGFEYSEPSTVTIKINATVIGGGGGGADGADGGGADVVNIVSGTGGGADGADGGDGGTGGAGGGRQGAGDENGPSGADETTTNVSGAAKSGGGCSLIVN